MKDRARLIVFAAAVLGIAVSSCSSQSAQSSLEPKVTTVVNPASQTTLQFAVGTAMIAGTLGLNTLETFRQSSGPNVGTSVLANAPTIVAPAGFTVPSAPDAYGDAGGGSITGSLQMVLTSAPPATTFNPTSGSAFIASSYGFLPAASNNSNVVPNLVPAAMPFYAATKLTYVGGPPAFVPPGGHASAQDGTFPSGYKGFTLGFADFQATPMNGAYTLSVVVPTGISATSGQSSFATLTAKATLASTALPAWTTAPAFAPDGSGGGVITTNFAGGGGVTEEYIELVNTGPANCQLASTGPYYYTFKIAPGQTTVTVPDSIGAAPPGTTQPPTLCTSAENTAISGTVKTGDGYLVYGFAVDYPLFNSAFPQSNGQVAPVLVGAGGQTDITTSAATSGTAP
jgi:hypothetical protein